MHWDRRRPSRSEGPSRRTVNPIITVTEHTPTPSPDFLRPQGSIDSQLDALSYAGNKPTQNWQDRKPSLTRSQTDSNITYAGEDPPEASGSSCYITKDGDIDIQVVLKATHAAILKDRNCCTLRVIEVILNLVELLMDMGVLKQCLRDEALAEYTPTSVADSSIGSKQNKKTSSANANLTGPDSDNINNKTVSSHRIIMSIIIKVLKHLGCPHGCADGQRGPAAEFLRTQCQNILARLNKSSSKQFIKFLRDYINCQTLPDVLELLHSYVGFCVDPSSLLSPLKSLKQTELSGVFSECISNIEKLDKTYLKYFNYYLDSSLFNIL